MKKRGRYGIECKCRNEEMQTRQTNDNAESSKSKREKYIYKMQFENVLLFWRRVTIYVLYLCVVFFWMHSSGFNADQHTQALTLRSNINFRSLECRWGFGELSPKKVRFICFRLLAQPLLICCSTFVSPFLVSRLLISLQFHQERDT